MLSYCLLFFLDLESVIKFDWLIDTMICDGECIISVCVCFNEQIVSVCKYQAVLDIITWHRITF